MIDWLTDRYVELVLNYKVLLGNPTQCSAVEALRLFSFTLLAVFAVRLLLHVLVFYSLRRRFPRYDEASHPRLWRIYRSLVVEMGLAPAPALHRFFDRRPLVFTIGSVRPRIFLAPALVAKLPEEELKAVLVHELTHVKRRDGRLLWLLEVVFLSIPLLIIQVAALGFIFSVQGSAYALLGALATVFLFRAMVFRWVVYLRELSCDDLSGDIIRDPLLLASSLISVCRLGRGYPKHRWSHALAFTKNFATPRAGLERRVRRLANYRRPRPDSGFRHYTSDAISQIAFIRRAKRLGFSLREIKELLSFRAQAGAKCGSVRLRAEAKAAELDSKIADLRRMRETLNELTGAWEVIGYGTFALAFVLYFAPETVCWGKYFRRSA